MKEHFEELLNPTNMPSGKEAESEASGEAPLISLAEVGEVVKQLFSGKVPSVEEIHPEMLKALDIVGLSWLTCLLNVAWYTVPVVWQTGVVVPIFKKGDRRVCSNYRGITLLSLPRKVYSRVLERSLRPIVEPQLQVEQCGFRPGRGTMDQHFTLAGLLGGHGSLPIQSTCALWTWRRLMTVSLGNPVGGTAVIWGTGAVDMCHSVLVQTK